MSKLHCFYHSADLDGHCGGAIVKYRFPEALMHPINYGDEFPWYEIGEDDIVYMVDFCLQPESLMHKLCVHRCANVHWIDHHSQTIKEVESFGLYPKGLRDTSRAACELTWEYLFPDKPVPLAVKLLSLYDSWTYQGHELEEMVLPFQMRMRMEHLNPRNVDAMERWSWILQPGDTTMRGYRMNDLIEEGKLLLRYDEEQKRRYVKTYGFETMLSIQLGSKVEDIHHFKAIAVNLGHTNSRIFDSVRRRKCSNCKNVPAVESSEPVCSYCLGSGYYEPHDLMLTFCRRNDRKWNVSLYSTKPDVDCGAIAKSFGGGGHRHAAGMQVTELPFEY